MALCIILRYFKPYQDTWYISDICPKKLFINIWTGQKKKKRKKNQSSQSFFYTVQMTKVGEDK